VKEFVNSSNTIKLSYQAATTLVHDSDTTALSYPAKYDGSPSTKRVFVLFLNAKTSTLWTVDEDPGPPCKWMAREGLLYFPPWLSCSQERKEATDIATQEMYHALALFSVEQVVELLEGLDELAPG